MTASTQHVTQLLRDWGKGDQKAFNKAAPALYEELRRLANRYLRQERSDHTLQATALVHEAFLRLVDNKNMVWQSRMHFCAVAAQMMRRILVDHARRRGRVKRGGPEQKLPLDEAINIPAPPGLDLVALDDALNELAAIDAQKSRVVELRYYLAQPQAHSSFMERAAGLASKALPPAYRSGILRICGLGS